MMATTDIPALGYLDLKKSIIIAIIVFHIALVWIQLYKKSR
jgi:hypothetical protein